MFTYEKEINKKDNHEYIVITGFEGSAKELTIPESIDSLPVEVIGSHAFAARQDLERVSIPETVTTLRSYVFHNSRSLKKISLYDSIDDYYDGVCRQCDNLEEVEITVKRNWFEVIRNFLADTDKALRFLIHNDETKVDACLSFPGYVYDFNENTMARTIQFSIAGAGYAYRECVDRRKIDYRQYDNLFEKAKIDGGTICEDIAIGRLLYPVELDDRHRKSYEEYLADRGAELLKRLIDASISDDAALGMLGRVLEYRGTFQSDDSSDALLLEYAIGETSEYAASVGNPKVTALFMEKSRRSSMQNFTFEF